MNSNPSDEIRIAVFHIRDITDDRRIHAELDKIMDVTSYLGETKQKELRCVTKLKDTELVNG